MCIKRFPSLFLNIRFYMFSFIILVSVPILIMIRCDLNEGERNYNVCFYMFSFMMVCALLVATQIQFRYLSPKQVVS